MANQKLFVDDEKAKGRVGNSKSTEYVYDGIQKLSIFWKGKWIQDALASPGDAFIVMCNGNKPQVRPLGIPHRNDDLLMWLVGFNKETRAHSESEYEDLLAQRKSEYRWWGYRDWTTTDEGFKFCQCNRSDCGGHYNLAAWVQTPVTKELVKRVLYAMRGVMFPEAFTKKLLCDRFGFTETDLQELDAFIKAEGLENVFYN